MPEDIIKQKAEALKLTRNLLEQHVTALQAETVTFEEPFKSLFDQFRQMCSSVLEKLPKDEKCGWEGYDLANLLQSLSTAVGVITGLNRSCKDLRTQLQAAQSQASEAAVAAAIQIKIKSGELTPKDAVHALCSAAKDTGVQEGRAAAAAEAKTATARNTLAQQAGLPLPPETILALDAAGFETAEKAAKERAEHLKKLGIQEKNPIRLRIWASEDQWKLITEILDAQRAPQGTPEPAAGASAGAATGQSSGAGTNQFAPA